jgi:lactoylglutathione lyase
MKQRIGYIALLVRDYDEAISFYTGQLGFDLIEDTDLDNRKRWVLVVPPNGVESRFVVGKGVLHRWGICAPERTG